MGIRKELDDAHEQQRLFKKSSLELAQRAQKSERGHTGISPVISPRGGGSGAISTPHVNSRENGSASASVGQWGESADIAELKAQVQSLMLRRKTDVEEAAEAAVESSMASMRSSFTNAVATLRAQVS